MQHLSEVENRETVVVKIGSDQMRTEEIQEPILKVLKDISERVNLIVVSSGAVAAGIKHNPALQKQYGEAYEKGEPLPLGVKQAASAVGNSFLLKYFEKYFGVGRVSLNLPSHRQLADEKAQENFVRTIQENFRLGILTLINEADALATSELTWGDNDQLAAHIAVLVEADKVLFLTGEKGVVRKKERKGRSRTIRRIDIRRLIGNDIEHIEEIVKRYTWTNETQISTGGIISKVIAAVRAGINGVDPYILSGKRPQDMCEILGLTSGESFSSVFYTHFIGGEKVTLEQIRILETFIKEKEIPVPSWEYIRVR